MSPRLFLFLYIMYLNIAIKEKMWDIPHFVSGWWNIRVHSELFHYLVVSGWIISIIWLDAGYRIVCFSKKMHRKTFVDCPRHYFFVYICCGPTQFSRTKWRPKLKVLSFGRFSLSNIFYDLSQSKLLGGPPPCYGPGDVYTKYT